jgi:hypothetical protein
MRFKKSFSNAYTCTSAHCFTEAYTVGNSYDAMKRPTASVYNANAGCVPSTNEDAPVPTATPVATRPVNGAMLDQSVFLKRTMSCARKTDAFSIVNGVLLAEDGAVMVAVLLAMAKANGYFFLSRPPLALSIRLSEPD